ncbi:MAG: class I SAM-dependent methyltransferase [Pseudomonadota bacterium]|nr:class I SAM-dependent methyltransferase [Pseudomonadota bacterium]
MLLGLSRQEAKRLEQYLSYTQTPHGLQIMTRTQESLATLLNAYCPSSILTFGGRVPVTSARALNYSYDMGVTCPNTKSSSVSFDYKRVPFPSEMFDLIVVFHMHEIVDKPEALCSEISRLLMPEGIVVFFGFTPFMLRLGKIANQKSGLDWFRTVFSPQGLVELCGVHHLTKGYELYYGYDIVPFHSSSWVKYLGMPHFRSSYLPSTSCLYKCVLVSRQPNWLSLTGNQMRPAGGV